MNPLSGFLGVKKSMAIIICKRELGPKLKTVISLLGLGLFFTLSMSVKEASQSDVIENKVPDELQKVKSIGSESIKIEKKPESSKSVAPENLQILKKALQRYKSSGEIEMKVKKTLTQEILAKETIYDGKLFLSKGKIRWEIETPDKTILVFDGINLWEAQVPTGEDKSPVQVAKAVFGKKTNKPDLFLALISGSKSIESTFKARHSDSLGLLEVYDLKSIENMSVKDVSIYVSRDTRLISKIKFIDDVGNKTVMEFSDIRFFQSAKPAHFKYIPPKGAQITNLN